MKTPSLVTRVLSLGLILAGTGWVQAQNLVVNPGFELGLNTVASDWLQQVASTGLLASVQRDDTDPYQGSYDMLFEVEGSSLDGAASVFIQQQTALFSIVPDQTYQFSFFSKLASVLGPGVVAEYQLIFLDSDGSDGGGEVSGGGGGFFQGQVNQVSYTQILAPLFTASANADAALILIQISSGAFDGSAASFYVDNISLSAIPEPSSVALLAAGALVFGTAMLRRRRA